MSHKKVMTKLLFDWVSEAHLGFTCFRLNFVFLISNRQTSEKRATWEFIKNIFDVTIGRLKAGMGQLLDRSIN